MTRGREFVCRCPFHQDNHPSFSINATSGLWICYSCHASGNLERLVTDVGGDTNPAKSLREIKRRQISAQRREHRPLVQEVPVIDPYKLYARYESFDSPPRWALSERMIDRSCAEDYGLRWSQAWIIPIWAPRVTDPIDGLRGWQFKRDAWVSNYPPGVKKSHTLFGLAQLKGRRAVLVESPLDVVRLASAGVPAVASFGALVSNYQMGLLEGHLDRLVLALDNDTVGREQTERIYPVLARRLPTKRLVYQAKDPGEMTDHEIEVTFG